MFLATVLLFKYIGAQNVDWPEQDLHKKLLDDYEVSVRPRVAKLDTF